MRRRHEADRAFVRAAAAEEEAAAAAKGAVAEHFVAFEAALPNVAANGFDEDAHRAFASNAAAALGGDGERATLVVVGAQPCRRSGVFDAHAAVTIPSLTRH